VVGDAFVASCRVDLTACLRQTDIHEADPIG